jgi:repressor of nif and glnA expression
MKHKSDKKIAILNVLKEQAKPVSSIRISEMLVSSGLSISERSVRLYLGELEKEGYVVSHGRRGRTLSEKGQAELHSSQIIHRPGYLSAKIDQMIYKMNFDLPMCSGKVVVNISIVDPNLLLSYVDKIYKVFEYGFGMGRLLMLAGPGEVIGEYTIPKGKVGFCTVCSITINGILLKHGIPMVSRFGGLLRLKDSKAFRFVEMIHYDGTSIDPLEVFIRSGMTDYHQAIRGGDGLIGASFREVPAESRLRLININQRLEAVGLGAIMEIGLPGQPLLDIPVSYSRTGVVVAGGLNPIAILEERDHRVFSRALSGLLEYDRLFPFEEFPVKLQQFV